MKPVIGLTGGIASGKSTVCRLLVDRGVVVIDADQLAREAAAPGTPGLQALVDHFGPEYLQEDGYLDRQKMGALVFSNSRAREELNGLLHPPIRGLARERIEEAKAGDCPYVVYDAALHVELGSYKDMDKLVVVATNPALQVRRVMRRNGFSKAEALNRINAQLPLSEKLKVADYVIHNDNDRAALKRRTLEVHKLLLDL